MVKHASLVDLWTCAYDNMGPGVHYEGDETGLLNTDSEAVSCEPIDSCTCLHWGWAAFPDTI